MRNLEQGQSPPIPRRLFHLGVNGFTFLLCYNLTNWWSQAQQAQRSFATTLDAHIPFVSWMVLPYVTSVLLFAMCFLLAPSAEHLRVASRRMLLATAVATLIFAVFPARFPLERPAAGIIMLLLHFDLPYNQLPSLHVAYALIAWPALKNVIGRPLLAAWLALIISSTLLTWQHTLADVAGGILLGIFCCTVLRHGRTTRHAVAFHYTLAALVSLTLAATVLNTWLGLYLCLSLALVAHAYWRREAGFLNKDGGRHPLASWLLYWPYLLGYRLAWWSTRLRRRPPFTFAADRLLVGRRLSAAESRQLPAGCHVIDLSPELPEALSLRAANYIHFPLLDLHAPARAQLRAICRRITELHARGSTVYLHCAMGYSRSRFVAQHYLRKGRA